MMETFIIFAFMGLFVVVWSPLGKALAERIRVDGQSPAQDLLPLELRVAELEKLLAENRKTTHQLKENLAFYESLLPSAEERARLADSD